MDITQLKFFVQVAELGGFAKASELLDVPQSTLSRQIRALELELRASLLYRHGRGVSLTAVGARFLLRAKGLLHAADVALNEIHEGEVSLRGRVFCGLTPSVGRMMIPDFVRRFRDKLPFAELSIVNQLSAQLHDQLRASRLDFAVLHNPPPSPNLNVKELTQQALYLMGTTPIGPDAKTVEARLLDGLPLVMPSSPHVTRQPLEAAAARLQARLDITIEIDAIDSLFQLVNQGFAHTVSTKVAMLSGWADQGLSVQKIVEPVLTTRLFMVSPLKQNITALQQAALEIAEQSFESTFCNATGLSHSQIA